MLSCLSIFHPTTPPDVRRAVKVLLAVSVLSILYAGLYGSVYSFRTKLGIGLPDVSTGAETLFVGLRAISLLTAAWAISLALASTPEVAARLRALWCRIATAANGRAVWGVAVVLAIVYAAARVAVNTECVPSTLADLTAGTARTPFQYRALVPFVVRQAVALTPALGQSLWVPYGIVEALASFGAYAAVRAFLRPYVSGEGERSAAALLMFIFLGLNLATPFRHNTLFFPWDTLSVAFFTGGLALMCQRKWIMFYVIFAIATINRETTCFLTIALVLSQWNRMPKRYLALHGVSQLAVWLGVKALLAAAYASNAPLNTADGATGLFVLPYVMNLGAVSGIPGLLLLCSSMGALWIVPLTLARRICNKSIRRLFRFMPIFFVGMFLVGEVLEVRIYSELIPLVLTAFILVVRSVIAEAAGHFDPFPLASGLLTEGTPRRGTPLGRTAPATSRVSEGSSPRREPAWLTS